MGNWFGSRWYPLVQERVIKREDNGDRGYWNVVNRESIRVTDTVRNLYVMNKWEDSMYYANYSYYYPNHTVQLNDIIFLPYMRWGLDDDIIGLVVRTDPIAILIYEEPEITLSYQLREPRYEYFLISREGYLSFINYSIPNYMSYRDTPLNVIKERLWKHRVNHEDIVGLNLAVVPDQQEEDSWSSDSASSVATEENGPRGVLINKIKIKF